MTRVLLFDTETTGLIQNTGLPLRSQPRVIEFYGAVVDDQEWWAVDEIEFLCDPGFGIEPIITQITGLRDHDLHGQPDFKEFIPAINGLMAKAEEVAAHNLPFDINMMDFEYQRAGFDGAPWPRVRTCTVAGTEWMKGHRLSLSNLHKELFGEAFEGAHRAREDVGALIRCFRKLREAGDI